MTEKTNVTTRGRTFTGTVIAAKMPKTATIQWGRWKFVPKYERYEKRRTRVKAHNPEHINAVEGDVVVVQECRRLSKTKNFIIIKKLEK